ncbi:type IV pilus modification PilV family protein [Francisella philomiragia]|uniref:type IV pilus modification PilV family protein n=1 Tax=Francisella philomiragia TaxID=28110 RepID=UPI001B8CBDE1|nr:photosystem I protein M (PsaM) [Francisella philomiragia]QUE31670.1 photosystem I protein M (PsaM) [Francisella philomiragia]
MILKFSRRRIIGTSLPELLVATVIAVVVLTALISTYMGVKHSYQEYKDKTTIDAKELQVKSIFYNFIKRTGFACQFGSQNQTYHDRTSDSLDNFFHDSSMIRIGQLPLGTSDHVAQSLEASCSGDCFQPGTDYIMIKREESRTFLSEVNSLSTELSLNSVEDISAGDYLLLCNKNDINLLKVASISSGSSVVNLSESPQGSDYYPGDYVGKYSLEVLYIRDSGAVDEAGQTIFSLYVYIKNSESNGMSYELVRGVQNLQIETATVSNGNLTWSAIPSELDLSSSNSPALKISFSIGEQTFSRIINL